MKFGRDLKKQSFSGSRIEYARGRRYLDERNRQPFLDLGKACSVESGEEKGHAAPRCEVLTRLAHFARLPPPGDQVTRPPGFGNLNPSIWLENGRKPFLLFLHLHVPIRISRGRW
jgi:hypothetical protein